MIELEQVTRTFGITIAVDGLDLVVPPGELFAFLGPNGAGKTTTIKLLVGLLRPTKGRVRIGGHDVVEEGREARRLVGHVPDEPRLYDKLTGREFLRFLADMYGLDSHQARHRTEREIERFGLSEFVDDLAESYSHGMKQRTVFAAAMIHDPAVLIVDEPMVGLDPHSVRLVKDLLRARAAEGITVFMSTHTLAVAEEIAGRIGIVNEGQMQFLGTLSELREQLAMSGQSLESLYLELVGDTGRPPGETGQPPAGNGRQPTSAAPAGEVRGE